MTPESMQNISQIFIAIGGIIVVMGTYGNYHYGKIINESKNMSDEISIENFNVNGNNGPTQVNLGSPGSTQIVNNRRVFTNFNWEKQKKEDKFIILVTLNQTDGIWDSGTKFKLQIKLNGPYKEYKFLQGFPGVMFDVLKSEDKEEGYIGFETATAPLNMPLILEIVSENEIDIEQVAVEPRG